MSQRERLASETDRCDGGIVNIILPLGASLFERQLVGSLLRSFGAHRCPGLIFLGAMHAVTRESKMMPFMGPTNSLHLLAASRVHGASEV
jgi:hypothetical protein